MGDTKPWVSQHGASAKRSRIAFALVYAVFLIVYFLAVRDTNMRKEEIAWYSRLLVSAILAFFPATVAYLISATKSVRKGRVALETLAREPHEENELLKIREKAGGTLRIAGAGMIILGLANEFVAVALLATLSALPWAFFLASNSGLCFMLLGIAFFAMAQRMVPKRPLEEAIRTGILGIPLIFPLVGWMLIIMLAIVPLRAEPAWLLDGLMVTGYVLLAPATVAMLRYAPMPSGEDPKDLVARGLWGVAGVLLFVGFIGQLFVEGGLLLIDFVLIYSGTILFGVLFFPSAYVVVRNFPQWRKWVVISAIIFSSLAAFFLYIVLQFCSNRVA